MATTPTISDRTQRHDAPHSTPEMCWCGQDIVHVEAAHCPRCGTARTRRSLPLLRVAA